MNKFILTILLLMGVYLVDAQQTEYVKKDSAIDLKFSDFTFPLEKASYKTISTKVIIEKKPKIKPFVGFPIIDLVTLSEKNISLDELPQKDKTALGFQTIKMGEIDVLDAPSFVFKDNSKLNLKYLDKAHGFYSNTINYIQQDKEGIIWFASGTDGLCRFDGKKMKVYTDKSGLPSNNINYIYYDSQDRLWIGTKKGLCYIKDHIIYRPDLKELATGSVTFVMEDSDLNLWFGTENHGAYHYYDDSVENYNDTSGLPGNHVLTIFQDQNNNVWMGFFIDGFCKFDGEQFFHYHTPSEKMAKSCQSIFENKDGIWFGFFHEPVLKYDGHHFYQYQFTSKKEHTVSSILENDQGMWFVDYGIGLIRYYNDEVTLYTDAEGLSSRSSLRGFVDRGNNIWLAHLFGGVSRLDKNIFQANDPVKGVPLKIAEGILRGLDNTRWYMPNGGKVVCEDSSSYTIYSDVSMDNFPPIRHSFDMEFLEDGNVVYATYSKGICFSDLKTNEYCIFEKGNYVLDISKGNNGVIWFATENNGLIKYDYSDFYFLNTNQGLSSNKISAVFCDRQGLVWVATAQNGLNILWGDKISHLNKGQGLSSNTINCFFEDEDYRVWVGTENGIDIISFYGTYHLNKGNGLISNKIRSITQDVNGFYWIATADGLSKIQWVNDSQIVVKNYNKNDGLNITDFNGSVLSCDDGQVIWGTNSNILSYTPILEDLDELPISITFGEDCINDTITGNYEIENGKVKIQPNGNFEVNFTAINWGKETEITYQYAIIHTKGDSSWVSLGLQNGIVLQDIPNGEYKLLVKALSDHRESEMIVLEFEFLPFWWQTNFVIILFSSVFLFLGPYIFYSYSKRAQRIQYKLEITVKEKTKELVKENKIKDALVQEIHHRVKNNLQSISSLVDMQLRSLRTDAERQALTDTQLRIGAMALVHEMLYASNDLSLVSVKSYLDELVTSINEMANTEKLPIKFEITTHEHLLSVSDCISFGILTSEIISNAIKYAFKGIENPQINIDLRVDQEYIYYCIKDNGVGMEFEGQGTSSSFGLRLVDVFARQLNAKLMIENDNGVIVRLKIPLLEEEV